MVINEISSIIFMKIHFAGQAYIKHPIYMLFVDLN
jgi:hypothetical protein